MGKMIYAGGRCKNPKKKPGWQAAVAQEAEWLKNLQGMKLFANPGRKFNGKLQRGAVIDPVKDGTLPLEQPKVGRSLGGFDKFSGGKKVARPEITYAEDPEMLARELKARERKFATAPAYNKGGDQYVSEDLMKDIMAGKTRRR